MPPARSTSKFRSSLEARALSRRVDYDSAPTTFDATPAVAVIVPVAIVVLILLSAGAYSYYLYRKRQTYRDQIVKPARERGKLVPSWVASWLGPLQTRLSFRRASRDPRANANAGASIDSLPTKNVSSSDVDSDVIELTLPHRPLSTYDRYAVTTMARPKAFGVPL